MKSNSKEKDLKIKNILTKGLFYEKISLLKKSNSEKL